MTAARPIPLRSDEAPRRCRRDDRGSGVGRAGGRVPPRAPTRGWDRRSGPRSGGLLQSARCRRQHLGQQRVEQTAACVLAGGEARLQAWDTPAAQPCAAHQLRNGVPLSGTPFPRTPAAWHEKRQQCRLRRAPSRQKQPPCRSSRTDKDAARSPLAVISGMQAEQEPAMAGYRHIALRI
jgi:hypothetical protein